MEKVEVVVVGGGPAGLPEVESLTAEQQRILAVLQRCHYRRQAAARELGMNRSTLWRKLQAISKLTKTRI